MKKIAFVVTVFAISMMASIEALAKDVRDMSKPPFIMSSYDEFNDMQKEQKEAYLKALELSFKAIAPLKENDSKKLEEASEWYPTWDHIRKVVYDYCEAKDAEKNCDKLIDLRIKILSNYAMKPFDP